MYAAGKGALNALTRHMANDFGKFSIRVNALRMGWIGGAPVYAFIDSQVAAGADRDTVVRGITDRIPLGVFRLRPTVPKLFWRFCPITLRSLQGHR